MKKKIFSLLLIFTMFFGFTIINVEAQAEFIDDNKFVVSNTDFDINEEDIKELLLFFYDYVETYNIPFDVPENNSLADIGNNLYGGIYIDFNADLISLDYNLYYYSSPGLQGLILRNYEDEIVFGVVYDIVEDTVNIEEIALYDFSLVITLFEEEIIEEEGLSIFGFFKNFYSNYIFPNNILDTQTLNLITAVTTLLFFIGVFRGIYSIFFRNKRK